MRTDWRWVLAVGISIGAFLLLYPNPVSPAMVDGITQVVPEDGIRTYEFRPSFCGVPAARKDRRCLATIGKWM